MALTSVEFLNLTGKFPTVPNAESWPYVSVLYNFDTTFDDNSANALTSTIAGSPVLSTDDPKFGVASALFNGIDSEIEVEDSPVLDLPDLFTIFLWAKSDQTLTNRTVFEIGDQFNSSGMSLDTSNDQFFVSRGSLTVGGVATGWLANTWTHVAITRDGSGVIRLFVDGRYKTGGASASPIATDEGMAIGHAAYVDPQTNKRWFKGNIDDFVILKGICVYTDSFRRPDQTYSPTYLGDNVPTYTNNGGKGDRRGSITMSSNLPFDGGYGLISNIIDGVFNGAFVWNSQADVAGYNITADFGSAIWVDEWRLKKWGSSTFGFWQPQVSNNGVDWTNAGAVQQLGGAPTSHIEFSNTTPYRYYRLYGSGGNLAADFVDELEFRIESGY